jgi:hypothetical protein
MPETRQLGPPLQGAGRLAYGFHIIDVHAHTQGQRVYAARGAFTTTAERGTWVAPANPAECCVKMLIRITSRRSTLDGTLAFRPLGPFAVLTTRGRPGIFL